MKNGISQESVISGSAALDLLKQDCDTFNHWREKHKGTVLDLTEQDLSGLDLSNYDLSGPGPNNTRKATIILRKCKLRHLKDSRLWFADLTEADLENACCVSSGGCQNFFYADLTNAKLTKTDFDSNSLTKANITGADVYQANFYNASLAGVQGLESASNVGYANWIRAKDLSRIQKGHIARVVMLTLECSWANINPATLLD